MDPYTAIALVELLVELLPIACCIILIIFAWSRNLIIWRILLTIYISINIIQHWKGSQHSYNNDYTGFIFQYKIPFGFYLAFLSSWLISALIQKGKKKRIKCMYVAQMIAQFKSSVQHFRENAEKDSLFYPEHEISKEILNIIEDSDKNNKQKIIIIITLYNSISKHNHYNGSGWYDFRLMIQGYFKQYDYATEWNAETGLQLVTER